MYHTVHKTDKLTNLSSIVTTLPVSDHLLHIHIFSHKYHQCNICQHVWTLVIT